MSMHTSYWESFLEHELERVRLQQMANKARRARQVAWTKVAYNIRLNDKNFESKYYFRDGNNVFVVMVDPVSGDLRDVKIISCVPITLTPVNDPVKECKP